MKASPRLYWTKHRRVEPCALLSGEALMAVGVAEETGDVVVDLIDRAFRDLLEIGIPAPHVLHHRFDVAKSAPDDGGSLARRLHVRAN